MGNCARTTQSKDLSCIDLPLKNVTNKRDKSGQLYSFKKRLENTGQNKKLIWDQLFSSRFSYRQNTSTNTQTQRKTAKQLPSHEPASYKIFFQNKTAQKTSQIKTQVNQLTSQQMSYKLTKQEIERVYDCGPSEEKLLTDDINQQLPRPQGKIIKKQNHSKKSNSNIVLTKQAKEITEKAKIEVQQPSIIQCLQSQEQFEGMYVQGQMSTIINFKISASNIEFVLPKSQAGPLIVSQIDYDYYTV